LLGYSVYEVSNELHLGYVVFFLTQQRYATSSLVMSDLVKDSVARVEVDFFLHPSFVDHDDVRLGHCDVCYQAVFVGSIAYRSSIVAKKAIGFEYINIGDCKVVIWDLSFGSMPWRKNKNKNSTVGHFVSCNALC